jgi:hypothetical protein
MFVGAEGEGSEHCSDKFCAKYWSNFEFRKVLIMLLGSTHEPGF